MARKGEQYLPIMYHNKPCCSEGPGRMAYRFRTERRMGRVRYLIRIVQWENGGGSKTWHMSCNRRLPERREGI